MSAVIQQHNAIWYCSNVGPASHTMRQHYNQHWICVLLGWRSSSVWPSRPIRSLRFIVTCTRIRVLIKTNIIVNLMLHEEMAISRKLSKLALLYLGSAQIYWFLFGSLISLFCAGFLQPYFSLSSYPINMKFGHDIPRVVRYTAVTFLSHPSCSSGFIWIRPLLKGKRQFLLTCKVSIYYLLALHGSSSLVDKVIYCAFYD